MSKFHTFTYCEFGKIQNSLTFHGSHPNYNNWVERALDNINLENLSDSELIIAFNRLNTELVSHINLAYTDNKSLHKYFETLKEFKVLN